MSDPELREVYSAANTQEAHMVRTALEEAGIDAQVVGDQLQNAVGELAAAAVSPRVWVHTEQFDQARKIIADYEDHSQSSATPSSPWTCTECGESNEPSFEICWKCQADRMP